MRRSGPKTTTVGLVSIVGILTAASLISIPLSQTEIEEQSFSGQVQDSFVRLVSLDREGNIPTWFSSAILLAASALLAVIARYRRDLEDPFTMHWAGLAVLFLCMSVDETAKIHEMFNTPTRAILHTDGFLYFSWVLAGASFVVLFAAIYLRFLMNLPSSTRISFLLAGIVFVAGAIGFESVSAHFFSQSGYRDVPYLLASNVEEFLEMIGVIIFVQALLVYIDRELPKPIFGGDRIVVESRRVVDR